MADDELTDLESTDALAVDMEIDRTWENNEIINEPETETGDPTNRSLGLGGVANATDGSGPSRSGSFSGCDTLGHQPHSEDSDSEHEHPDHSMSSWDLDGWPEDNAAAAAGDGMETDPEMDDSTVNDVELVRDRNTALPPLALGDQDPSATSADHLHHHHHHHYHNDVFHHHTTHKHAHYKTVNVDSTTHEHHHFNLKPRHYLIVHHHHHYHYQDFLCGFCGAGNPTFRPQPLLPPDDSHSGSGSDNENQGQPEPAANSQRS